MAKTNEKYEVMYILNPNLGEEDTAALVEKFKALVEQHGTLDEMELMGKRRLAYEINDLTEGYYVLVKFTSAPDFPAELDRILGITDGVIRSLITVRCEQGGIYMLNIITLMGRLTRDPELRYTQSGTPVASFTLAVDRDFGGKDGGEKQTDFIDCVAWRQTGEFVSKYFTKGSMAVVSGRLQIRDWQDKDGNKRRSAEVVAENVYFGEAKRPRDGSDSGFRESPPPRSSEGDFKGSAFSELEGGDGDLPF